MRSAPLPIQIGEWPGQRQNIPNAYHSIFQDGTTGISALSRQVLFGNKPAASTTEELLHTGSHNARDAERALLGTRRRPCSCDQRPYPRSDPAPRPPPLKCPSGDSRCEALQVLRCHDRAQNGSSTPLYCPPSVLAATAPQRTLQPSLDCLHAYPITLAPRQRYECTTPARPETPEGPARLARAPPGDPPARASLLGSQCSGKLRRPIGSS